MTILVMTMIESVELDDALLAEFGECIKDPIWRLENLYWVLNEDGEAIKFKLRRAQKRFLRRMWHRNIILKARQLGFTTLIQILILDSMLFRPNVRCGVIAHKKEDAESFFSDKILFAYDNLPEVIKAAMPAIIRRGGTLRLANNSQVRVATSLRSGTLQILHVSELAKLHAERPGRADEVITGTLPTVQPDGLVFIESTAEGAEGPFYRINNEARALAEASRMLTRKDFKFHFFPWWQDPKYQLAEGVPDLVQTERDIEYFDVVEAYAGREITLAQRAWYLKTLAELGDDQKMWREFPSTPDEPFRVVAEGAYYKQQMTFLRKNSRITTVPVLPGLPVHTFWDLGNSDYTAIWFMQMVGREFRFVRFYENCGESLTHYAHYLQQTGYVFGTHYLPHDATHERLSADNKTQEQMLRDLGIRNIEIVPRIEQIQSGIEMTRQFFVNCWFDEAGCKIGLQHLEMYRKDWNSRQQVFADKPRHDSHSHGADAFRQAAQKFDAILRQSQGSGSPRRRPSSRVT